MGDLGDELKRAREDQGISLEQISGQTRIGVRLLQAIEDGSFDRLPGGIFNRSFVRQYARCLGLDEEQAVRDYLRATSAGRETLAPTGSPPPRPVPHSNSSIDLRLILGAVCIGLIALAAFSLAEHFRQSQKPANPPAPIALLEQPDSLPLPQSVPTQPSPALSARETTTAALGEEKPGLLASTSAGTARILSPPGSIPPLPMEEPESNVPGGSAEELLLQISARSTVWLSIIADGEKKWQGTLAPNQAREVQAVETIRVTMGNAGGVELTLNGKPLGPMGHEGEVKTVTISARQLSNPAP